MAESLLRRTWDGWTKTAALSNIPLGAVVIIGGMLSYRSHAMLRQDRDMVVHTYQVIGTLQQTQLAVEEAETAQRGFVITGDQTFLAPYVKAKEQTVPAMDGDLRRLLVRNAAQRERFGRLRTLLDRHFHDLQETIETRRDNGFGAAQSLVQSRADRQMSNQIRNLIGEMDGVERKLLTERDEHVAASERRILVWGGVTVALSFSVRLFLAWRAARQPLAA